MGENYIVINGKKMKLTEEQLKQLCIEVRNNPFERGAENDEYFSIDGDGVIVTYNDNSNFDDRRYENVNHFNDESFAKQVALHQLLYRKLLKFAYDNGCEDTAWNNQNKHWYIFYNYIDDYFDYQCTDRFKLQNVYFLSPDAASHAIKEVVEPFVKEHPEFVW